MFAKRLAIRACALLVPLVLALAAAPAKAQVGAPPAAGQNASLPMITLQAPNLNVPASAANQFEHGDSIKSLPQILLRQFRPFDEVAPESIINPAYLRTRDGTAERLTLKQVIYLALANNPGVKAAWLGPVIAQEGVRQQNGVFDLDLQSTLDNIKTVTPITTSIETTQGLGLSDNEFDWNFSLVKILASTNGTLSLTFNNDYQATNNLTQTINPFYTPTMAVSLAQPLLRNFGWKFAVINVLLAESAQKQSQAALAQQLFDFTQRVAQEYWAVVQAEENLRVAREALRFNQDLVRQNEISVRVGTMAPLDLLEAQSAAAAAEANVYTAEAQLHNTRAALREDVMLNPRHTFIPAQIVPAEEPNPAAPVDLNEQQALEHAVLYRPSLSGMREAIRGALLQVRFQENQTLPQVNIQGQYSINSMAGGVQCGPTFGVKPGNCFNPALGSTSPNGYALPFAGGYGTALDQLFGFSYYNYAAVLSYERPIANAAARAALAQSRIEYEQLRLQYRSGLSQAVTEVQSALANLRADVARVKATHEAAGYARHALHDEQLRFRVGMATTHDLLQYQSEMVSAEGNEVQTGIDLENARVALGHADGTLLKEFGVDFQLQDPHENPWYARF